LVRDGICSHAGNLTGIVHVECNSLIPAQCAQIEYFAFRPGDHIGRRQAQNWIDETIFGLSNDQAMVIGGFGLTAVDARKCS